VVPKSTEPLGAESSGSPLSSTDASNGGGMAEAHLEAEVEVGKAAEATTSKSKGSGSKAATKLVVPTSSQNPKCVSLLDTHSISCLLDGLIS
jgi:hypothetical protein